MGSADNRIKSIFSCLANNVVEDVNDAGVRAAENDDQSPLGVQDEGLVVQKNVRIPFPIGLGKEFWVSFLERRFSWYLPGQENVLFYLNEILIKNEMCSQ